MNFNEIKIGLKHELIQAISSDDVIRFAKNSGDNNPIHIDDKYAKSSFFGSKIVHGMLIGAFFSKVIASDLPGPGSIYLNQSMNFLRPIYHNSEVKICIEVTSLKQEKKIVFLKTNCWSEGELAIEGTAVVKCLE
jgi:3-hydroxybutyryl-CoA dehydratase